MKIIKLIIVGLLICQPIEANISKNQVEKYITDTVTGMEFENYKESLLKRILKFFDIKNPKDFTPFKTFLNHPSYISNFTNVFFDLEDNLYNEIIQFYTTEIGKKYFNSRIFILKNYTPNKIKKEYEILQLSENRILLIDSVIEEFNFTRLTMESSIVYFNIYNRSIPKKMQKSENELKKHIDNYRDNLIQYHKMFVSVMYKNFTENELKKILLYAKSEAGKIENKLLWLGKKSYMESIMPDTMSLMTQSFK